MAKAARSLRKEAHVMKVRKGDKEKKEKKKNKKEKKEKKERTEKHKFKKKRKKGPGKGVAWSGDLMEIRKVIRPRLH